jgi:hypothetical protein
LDLVLQGSQVEFMSEQPNTPNMRYLFIPAYSYFSSVYCTRRTRTTQTPGPSEIILQLVLEISSLSQRKLPRANKTTELCRIHHESNIPQITTHYSEGTTKVQHSTLACFERCKRDASLHVKNKPAASPPVSISPLLSRSSPFPLLTCFPSQAMIGGRSNLMHVTK